MTIALVAGAALAATGCAPEVEAIIGCEPSGGARPVCGFMNPEDLAVLPGGGALIVSQFGAMDGSAPGNLALFEPASDQLEVVFRGGSDAEMAADWGDPGCPGPPSAAFTPHGIDLAPRPDGALRLLVVNHGGRESIEFFEVVARGSAAELTWRGCAIPPAGSFMNDVVALPDGGLLATHMFPKEGALGGLYHLVRGQLGLDTGYVLEWQRSSGWQEVPGTAAPMPNGIEVSPDGRTIYLNAYLAGELRRISRDSGELLGTVEIQMPDNVTWSEDGHLLVASHRSGFLEMMGCNGLTGGSCPIAYAIVAVDPESLAAEIVYQNEGPPMGAGTVAVEIDGELFIGSFAGDRVVRVSSR